MRNIYSLNRLIPDFLGILIYSPTLHFTHRWGNGTLLSGVSALHESQAWRVNFYIKVTAWNKSRVLSLTFSGTSPRRGRAVLKHRIPVYHSRREPPTEGKISGYGTLDNRGSGKRWIYNALIHTGHSYDAVLFRPPRGFISYWECFQENGEVFFEVGVFFSFNVTIRYFSFGHK